MSKSKYLIAIDFETANSHPLSACAVGIIVFLDGEIVFEYESLIKPPYKYREFAYFNTKIHNITLNDVKDAKYWKDIYPKFEKYFNEGVIVAHNASFDVKVLKNLNNYYKITYDDINYYCTVELSRKVLPYLDNHKLNTVSNYLEISLDHHNAKSDAVACGLIVHKCMSILECSSANELFNITNMMPKTLTI